MRLRSSRVLLALGAAGLGVVACAEIVDVQDIPTAVPDAAVDATKHMDATRADARSDAGRDARPDVTVGCKSGNTMCSPDGLGVETCDDDGGWSAPVACAADTPVCVGGTCACEPGATRCVGQTFETCVTRDAAAADWPTTGVDCPGTCTRTGCGAQPPSCALVDGGSRDAGTHVDASTGIADCPKRDGGTESCCTSNEDPAGTFDLSYDGLTNPSTAHQATVSAFRLDRFEVTVSRFRRFFNAVNATDGGLGWTPASGSGKHAHLNGGQGLVDRASDGGAVYETGWNASWDASLVTSTSPSKIFSGVNCRAEDRTWTPMPGANEALPMNCVTWVQAYAFCIWDGGFLPSEAEWNYAASGGGDQRVYPWSASLETRMLVDAGAAVIDCSHANTEGCFNAPPASGVGLDPKGDSKWGQADLAGNVAEWTLDVFEPYAPSCTDCAFLGPVRDGGSPLRVRRGGAFVSLPPEVEASYRGYDSQDDASYVGGVRCARTP